MQNFTDNKATLAKPDMYICVQANVEKLLKSWQLSVFSYEWLSPDGTIKTMDAMNPAEAEKRSAVETAIENGRPLEKPVLGIGIQDNIEIGSGRAVLLTLAAKGLKIIPIHIPKSNESDFKDFLSDVS